VPVPENPELRRKLEHYTLEELTQLLGTYKALHNTTDVDTPKRAIRAIEIQQYYKENKIDEREFPSLRSLTIGVRVDREVRRQKISQRLRDRLDQGMLQEVEGLLRKVPADALMYYGLEYKYLTQCCIGQLSYEEMVRQLEIAIHQFAKRQMTWFRGMERRGTPIIWQDGSECVANRVGQILSLLDE
ncbi:MAG: tRNA (adenosine(37)-N6)-dimethylallyltransferase MiaA, partial [Bacteroidaceae bacterium]